MGQTFGFGVIGGVPATSAFQTGSFFTLGFGQQGQSATRRYTIGPMVELRLVKNVRAEFDVLYKPLGYDLLTKSSVRLYDLTRVTAKSWEFPILAKVGLPVARRLQPFAAGGISFRAVSRVAVSTLRTVDFDPIGRSAATSHPALDVRSSFGFTVGAGVSRSLGPTTISPQLRYTRWGRDRDSNSLYYLTFHANQNQVDVLLSISFHSRR